ncbi:MFS transporter [uncultured Psychroserpens sp.]|uniref:MFS transporter n=1 Tax=uncultured Psychroserpens sp. TaxID=255436 RepID=UPI0026342100|nr:MFS transporter [uncultured Psychroserpens sp.]
MFSSSSQFLIMAPILPEICRQLHVDESLLGLLITVYSLTLGVVALFSGYVSDNIGRRKIILLGSGLMATTLILHYIAYDYYSLLVIRILTGVSGGILTGSCISFVRDYFPYNKRGWANGVIATGSAIGQIAAIPLGVIFAKNFGFATPFMFFGFVMCLVFGLAYFFIPQIKNNRTKVEIKPISILKGYIQILKASVYRILSISYILMFFSITVYLVYFPKWLEASFRSGAKDIALVFFFGGCASLLASPFAGKLTDVVGRKPVTIISNFILTLILGLSLVIELSYMQATAVFFLFMLCVSGRLVSFQSLASDITSSENRGQVMCLMIAIGQIGMALGSGIAGLMYSTIGFELNIITAAIASLIMAMIIWKVIPTVKTITV